MKMEYNLSSINAIKDILIQKKKTLSIAESVTSGHLQAAFSLADSASGFYQGGITLYNVGQKCKHLNIEPIHALQTDCVSEVVAVQMAQNINKMFLSDFGIGITGFATKAPDMGINKLYAYAAVAQGEKIIFTKKLLPVSDKEGYEVQISYTLQTIDNFFKILKAKM